MIEIIGWAAQFASQPGNVIVYPLDWTIPAGVVQKTIVQDHILEAKLRAFGVNVHLANCLGLVAIAREFSRQGSIVIPGDTILIADASMRALAESGEERCPCRDASGCGRIGVFEARSAQCQLVQVRGLYDRVIGHTQAIAAPLVNHD